MKKIIVECEDNEIDEIFENIKQAVMRRDPMKEPVVYTVNSGLKFEVYPK